MKLNQTILLILLPVTLSLTQTEDFTFRQLTDADGLSQSTIFDTIQDEVGYLWFGTIDGLNRYDGYEFRVYENDPADSTSISDNFITALFEDSEGYIWIGTVNGYLNRFDRMTDKFKRLYINDFFEITTEPNSSFYNYPLAFSRNQTNSVTDIAEDQKGYLWIGTWGNGIIRVDRRNLNGVHIYNKPEYRHSLSSNKVLDILIDDDNEIWVATFGGGLNKLNPNKIREENNESESDLSFSHYCYDKKNEFSLSDDKLVCLFEDKDKNIWIGTYLGGLNKLDAGNRMLPPEKAKFVHYKKIQGIENSLSDNTVMAIEQDKDGQLWIGTFGSGIDRFNSKTKTFTHFSQAADHEILSLYVDRSGILWVGSHLGEGVTKIQKRIAKFGLANSKTSGPLKLNEDVVWSIFRDSGNNLWVGTYKGGLNYFDGKDNRLKVYTNDPKVQSRLSDNHIRAVAEDNFGNIWVGTYSGGLNRINPVSGSVNVFKNDPGNPNSISANQVLDIYIQSDTVIWAATYGGGINKITFSKNSSGTPQFFAYRHNPENPASISDDRVYTILPDSKKNIWVGTYGGGLNLFDPSTGKFISFRYDSRNTKSIASDKILSLLEDPTGQLWIGTAGGGLNRFDRTSNTFKRYSVMLGLTSPVIYGILEDNKGNLWLSSDDGIFKFNPATEKFLQFGLEDGLQSMEYSGGAYFKDKEGRMYFGGINGLNYFHPDSIKINLYKPPVVISSIKILDRQLSGETDELILSYDKNFISIEYATLDFSKPYRSRYRYIMEGFQKYWTNTDASRRIASYTNLPAGEYLFRVMGTNSDGVWNENEATLRIIINPPFWQTWWFATLVIILVGFLLYYLSTVRIKNQLAIEKIKTKIASDLHDNIGAGLTEISILSEVAVRKGVGPDDSVKKLKKISETSRQLVDSMSDIVWVVNPQRDSLHDLIIKLKDSYNEFFGSIGISLQVKNVDKSNDIKLPMEYKQNLLLIFKEAINNSIKHSKCKKMILEANVRNDYIDIYIKDDGIGFNSARLQYGNGMKNMINRAKNIDGEINWTSAPQGGTKVQFIGKLSRINKLKTILNI